MFYFQNNKLFTWKIFWCAKIKIDRPHERTNARGVPLSTVKKPTTIGSPCVLVRRTLANGSERSHTSSTWANTHACSPCSPHSVHSCVRSLKIFKLAEMVLYLNKFLKFRWVTTRNSSSQDFWSKCLKSLAILTHYWWG